MEQFVSRLVRGLHEPVLLIAIDLGNAVEHAGFKNEGPGYLVARQLFHVSPVLRFECSLHLTSCVLLVEIIRLKVGFCDLAAHDDLVP